MVKVGGGGPTRSSFMIVHVTSSPAPNVTVPPLSSFVQLHDPASYPSRFCSEISYVPCSNSFGWPLVTCVSPIKSAKSPTEASPPSSFTTCFKRVKTAGSGGGGGGAISSFVIVQTLDSPSASVTLPLASQSPPQSP